VKFSVGQRRVVALFVLPAVFAFGVQSALELFHPLEEAQRNLEPHGHLQFGLGPSLHDSSHADPGHHEHHYCAHSNALAFLAHLETAFLHVGASSAPAAESAAVAARSPLSVFERGPPAL
jgi:hypothetical protein